MLEVSTPKEDRKTTSR